MSMGSGITNYTPPSSIRQFVRRLALLPAIYAEPESFILLPESLSRVVAGDLFYSNIVDQKNIRLIDESDLRGKCFEVHPWGWDSTLFNRLNRAGIIWQSEADVIKMHCLKRKELSHRRLTIQVHKRLNSLLNKNDIALPLEFFDTDTAINWAKAHHGCYLKSPWSSSGKGIFCFTSSSLSMLKSWVDSVIRKQGSVMAEEGVKRALDFATEWTITDGRVKFDGFSVFFTGRHGAYSGNLIASQKELKEIIISKAYGWDDSWIDALNIIITEFIAPHYNGHLGIDGLIGINGEVNLCVELNIRMTMGHVALALSSDISQRSVFYPGQPLFSDNLANFAI